MKVPLTFVGFGISFYFVMGLTVCVLKFKAGFFIISFNISFFFKLIFEDCTLLDIVIFSSTIAPQTAELTRWNVFISLRVVTALLMKV